MNRNSNNLNAQSVRSQDAKPLRVQASTVTGKKPKVCPSYSSSKSPSELETKSPFQKVSKKIAQNTVIKDKYITTSSSSSSSAYTYHKEYLEKKQITVSEVVSKNLEHTWCTALAPVHIKGLDNIAKLFGRSRGTLRIWTQEGAPIIYDGVSYYSEYNTLFAWLLNRYKPTGLENIENS